LLEKESDIIGKYGGDIDKFVGDEVLAVFSGEEAARRACAAAFEIIRACGERAQDFDGLQVGAGISSGAVIHGMIGSARRADFTVIGDAVNVASRLCAIAKPMQIVAGEETKREAERWFIFKGPYAARLKGKTAPLRVWLLELEKK
jgi:adenylate cyclase